MKSLVFGSRRSTSAGPQPAGSIEAALAPAVEDGRWHVPARFNFTRDVVEALAKDQKRRALTYLGRDVVIEPRTFQQLAHGAARWATLLRDAGVRPGDRVLVLAGTNPDWVEIMLAGLKVGAITVPSNERLSSSALDIRIAASGAKVVVASRRAQVELARCASPPTVLSADQARREAMQLPTEALTHDTAARDPAFIVSTTGRTNGPRGVLHTHASTFAARVPAEHWLDAGFGDVVWCTASADSPHALWSTLFGPWARGASVVLHDGEFDPVERLDLLQRFGVTVLCQTPAEYRALAETGLLTRYRWARPRRLVSTGDELSPDVVQAFEAEWGLTIHDGYGQAEAGIVAGHWGDGAPVGSIGRALPGYDLAVVDERGEVLPAGYEGALALRGNPPSLFEGYWNARGETNAAYRGDWYVTGDVAVEDAAGVLWLAGRLARGEIQAPIVVADERAPIAEPPRADPVPVERAVTDSDRPRRRIPLFARLTATLWLLVFGVMVGGAAIPHAQDKPRVVPKSEDVPNAICLPPAPRP